VLAAASLVIAFPAVRAYATVPPPALQAVNAWAATTLTPGTPPPVVAMHRRQELDMRRPLLWEQPRLPAFTAHLPAPAKHEWLELVKFWNAHPSFAGDVFFLADPPRSDLRLIDRHALHKVAEYRWPFEAIALLGGVRPNVMDFYRISQPTWFAGEGWALTPETAGVARDEGKGPGRAPIQAWVRRQAGPVRLMIGGRKLAGVQPTPVTVAIDGRTVWSATVSPGFFLQFVSLDAGALAGEGAYATLTVRSETDEVAIEQFDVQAVEQIVYGFGDGWQEAEYNPATGRLWRWTSERAVLRAMAPRRQLTLHLDGEFETSAKTAHVTVRAGDRVLAAQDVPRRFAIDVQVPSDVVADGAAGGETQLTIESDQWYVPAETNWRPTQDRRHLALRIFECELR